MDNKRSENRTLTAAQRKTLVTVFCVVILFFTGYVIGVLANINVHIPMKNVPVASTVVTTTAPTTTLPLTTTEPPTTVPATLPTTTTTTAAPTTTAPAEDECCLAGLCDTIKGFFGTIFPCLAEEKQ